MSATSAQVKERHLAQAAALPMSRQETVYASSPIRFRTSSFAESVRTCRKRQAPVCSHSERERKREIQTKRETDREIGGGRGREQDRDRETDRQRERERETNGHTYAKRNT